MGPDGKYRLNGAVVSSTDHAAALATTAANAARNAPAQPAPPASVQPATMAAAPKPLGNSPVARAIQSQYPGGIPGTIPPAAAPSAPSAQPAPGTQPAPTAAPDAPKSPGLIEINGQKIDPASLPPTQGYGFSGTPATADQQAAYQARQPAANPYGLLANDAPEVVAAKQLLGMSDGIGGRNYKAGNLAKATPQQILSEAALLPQRQQQQAGQIDQAALKAAMDSLKPNAGQPVDPNIAASLYVQKGGKDPKQIEALRQAGVEAAKFSAPVKPQPGSAGYSTITLPGGGTVVRDNATGSPLSGGDIQQPKEAPKKAEAEVNFETNIGQALSGVKKLREVIGRSGNYESGTFGNSSDATLLDQLPYQLAIQMAKIADPGSVAREGEVASAKKYLIPMGLGTTNTESLAALDNLEASINGYKTDRQKSMGQKPSAESAPAAKPPVDPAAALAELQRRKAGATVAAK